MLLMKLNQKMEVYKFKNKNKNEVFYGILKKNKIFKITNSIIVKINIDYSKFFSIKISINCYQLIQKLFWVLQKIMKKIIKMNL